MQEAIKQALHIDIRELNPKVSEREQLPIRMKGLGVRNLVDRRHREFTGGVMQGVQPLLDRIAKEGIRMPGRLNRNRLNAIL